MDSHIFEAHPEPGQIWQLKERNRIRDEDIISKGIKDEPWDHPVIVLDRQSTQTLEIAVVSQRAIIFLQRSDDSKVTSFGGTNLYMDSNLMRRAYRLLRHMHILPYGHVPSGREDFGLALRNGQKLDRQSCVQIDRTLLVRRDALRRHKDGGLWLDVASLENLRRKTQKPGQVRKEVKTECLRLAHSRASEAAGIPRYEEATTAPLAVRKPPSQHSRHGTMPVYGSAQITDVGRGGGPSVPTRPEHPQTRVRPRTRASLSWNPSWKTSFGLFALTLVLFWWIVLEVK